MILGILGGMGPAATVDLLDKITRFSHANKDQEHIHLVIDSNTEIPDRTEYITGGDKDPTVEMIRTALRLEMMGANYIAIPCNTAHYFYDNISQYTKVPLIHMIDETAKYLAHKFPDERSYLLLATEGTYLSGIYKDIFNRYNLEVLEPDQNDKKTVMSWIYKVKSGDFQVAPSDVDELIHRYAGGEVQTILGCTELPLLAEHIRMPKKYIDPLTILAYRCVELAEEGDDKNHESIYQR